MQISQLLNKLIEDEYFTIVLSVICGFCALLLIIIKIKNRNTIKKICELESKIKPFEIKIDKNAEKLKPSELLEEGDILSRDIRDKLNFPMFSKGMVVTNEIKKRIIDNNIGVVWVRIGKFKGF